MYNVDIHISVYKTYIEKCHSNQESIASIEMTQKQIQLHC